MMMREMFWLVELAIRPGGLDGFQKTRVHDCRVMVAASSALTAACAHAMQQANPM
jgi:hypothetical protein